jgi:membrane protein
MASLALPTTRSELRQTAADVLEGYGRHHVLTYASAIAYQVLSALIPFALFALALAGILNRESLWTDHLRPTVASSSSGEVMALLDKTIGQVLHHKQLFWLTAGLLITLWELGGAVRATMEALDTIHGTRRQRSRRDKYVTSTWLAAIVGALWLVALALLTGGGSVLPGALGVIVRCALAALVLTLATAMTLRIAPASRLPVRWVSFGSLVIVGGWLVVVGGYVLYATSIASYASVFGSLASLFVLLVAVYLSAAVFLTGALIDDAARRRGS